MGTLMEVKAALWPLALVLLLPSITNGLTLELGSKQSVCDATVEIINGIMDYSEGSRYGGTVGMFQQPYYWWEAGLVFGGLIDNWFICENDSNVKTIQDSIYHQAGPSYNYMILNQSKVEANDDQLFWGLTTLEAAERGFPTVENEPTYLELSQAVYNTMYERWDDECRGGLRWQIFSNMSGWDYKSTVANAGLFAMGARLGKFTSNKIYFETSARVLRWIKEVTFIRSTDNYYIIYDGSNIADNQCSVINGAIWSYNYALFIMGSAYLYAATNEDNWKNEVGMFLNGIEHFLTKNDDNILYEYQCEVWGKCNNDQRAFRAIVARALGEVVQLVPDHAEKAQNILNASAKGAAFSCSGGSDGVTCGRDWSSNSWDGLYGLGEQIAALEIIQNTLMSEKENPAGGGGDGTGDNGGNSDNLMKGSFITNLGKEFIPQIRTNTHTSTITHTSTYIKHVTTTTSIYA